jgi:hypothetical protein
VKKSTGHDPTAVIGACCTGSGDTVVIIGLPGGSSQEYTHRAAPTGAAVLTPELSALYRKVDQTEHSAAQKGQTDEDGTPGYRLFKEKNAHAAEMALRAYAVTHESEMIGVLESSSKPDQRAMAADALGFGARTEPQLQALVGALRDVEPTVRENAARALGTILRGDPSAAARIAPENLIAMIHSTAWADRKLASPVLLALTQSRDPQVLARLKSQASDALLEMARWRSEEWSHDPRVVLARLAGVAEDRIEALAWGPVDGFLAATATKPEVRLGQTTMARADHQSTVKV